MPNCRSEPLASRSSFTKAHVRVEGGWSGEVLTLTFAPRKLHTVFCIFCLFSVLVRQPNTQTVRRKNAVLPASKKSKNELVRLHLSASDVTVLIAEQGGAVTGSTRESECIEVAGVAQLRPQVGRLCLGVRGIPLDSNHNMCTKCRMTSGKALAVVLRGPWEDSNRLPPCTSPIQDKSPGWDTQLRWAAGEEHP